MGVPAAAALIGQQLLSGTAHSLGGGPVGRGLNYAGNHFYPNAIPSPPEIFDLLHKGKIEIAAATWALRQQGITFSPLASGINQPVDTPLGTLGQYWFKVWDAGRPQLTATQATIALNRGIFNQTKWNDWLDRNGFLDAYDRGTLLRLANQLPGIQDVIRFAVREAFLPQGDIDALGYDAEYPVIVSDVAARLGYKTINDALGSRIPGGDLDIGKLFWRAHWELPSPTMGYEMLHRLRPDRVGHWAKEYPNLKPFVQSDLSTLLKLQDYPEVWRDRLGAISYVPITRVDIRRLYKEKIYTAGDVYDAYRDRGMNDQDAKDLTRWTVKTAGGSSGVNSTNRAVRDIAKAYQIGAIDEDEARGRLTELEFDADEVNSTVEALDFENDIAFIQKAIAAIRKAFINGKYNEQDGRQKLQDMDIAPPRIDQYLDTWKIDLLSIGKEIPAGRIRKLVAEGIINLPEADRRLFNLGYSHDDIQVLLAEMIYDRQIAILKAQIAAEKERQKQIKLLKQLEKEQRAEHERTKRLLASHGSPAMLKRWLSNGLIGPGEVAARLDQLDWPADDAQRLIKEALEG